MVDSEVTAEPMLFLTSDLASMVTGAAIQLDAGQLVLPGADLFPAALR